MRAVLRRRWVIPAAIAVLAALVVVVVWLVSPDPDAPRARVYTSKRACLLTEASGISTEPAASVWQGMQDASASTQAQVSFQTSTVSTAAEAVPYLNAMIEQSCGVIVTTGDAAAGAAEQIAPNNSTTHFIVVGPDAQTSGNLKRLPVDGSLRSQVASAVSGLTQS